MREGGTRCPGTCSLHRRLQGGDRLLRRATARRKSSGLEDALGRRPARQPAERRGQQGQGRPGPTGVGSDRQVVERESDQKAGRSPDSSTTRCEDVAVGALPACEPDAASRRAIVPPSAHGALAGEEVSSNSRRHRAGWGSSIDLGGVCPHRPDGRRSARTPSFRLTWTPENGWGDRSSARRIIRLGLSW